jgi:DNA-binding CsgD family transcriptional regulator
MQAEIEIQGEDVIGVPGQALTARELRVLVGLADGETPNTIAAAINADKAAIRYLEASIKAKLGAKTHPHMIARGFTLGVLFPRALCLLLAVLCSAQADLDAMRNRAPRNSRAPSTHTRLVRAGTGSARGGSKTEVASLGGLSIVS